MSKLDVWGKNNSNPMQDIRNHIKAVELYSPLQAMRNSEYLMTYKLASLIEESFENAQSLMTDICNIKYLFITYQDAGLYLYHKYLRGDLNMTDKKPIDVKKSNFEQYKRDLIERFNTRPNPVQTAEEYIEKFVNIVDD